MARDKCQNCKKREATIGALCEKCDREMMVDQHRGSHR